MKHGLDGVSYYVERQMRSQGVGTMLLGFSLCRAFCQAPSESNPGPVQAELIAPLNVRRLTPGATIFARVTLDWKGLGCSLKTGSTLEATVEAAERRKGGSGSQLALAFTKAQCNGPDLKPMNLLLAAVAQAPADWENVPNATLSMPMTFADNGGHVNPGMGIVSAGQFTIPQMELRGIRHRFPMSAKVQPGDVLEIRGMKLGIGTGPNRSSVLTTKDRDLTLDMFTQFLLVPADLVYGPASVILASTSSPAIAGASPAPFPPVHENDLEVCAPPGCAVDLPVAAHELAGHDATSIALHPFGYEPRLRTILEDFSNEETLAWLGPSHLLFAFNTHPLIRRAWTPNSNTLRRMIRAVLFDADSRAVVRAVDWEITDTRQYIWPFDGNRILVHVGNELRVYSGKLEFERSIQLAGPLSFVRIAPNGNLIAIATLRERHSAELHARLHDDMGGEPEEDVDVAILDGEFNTIARASTVSGLLPPTLLNEGQVNLLSQPGQHYRLALRTWEGKAVSLARFTSICTPSLSSVAPDHLFLRTCSTSNGAGEYRVLRADGKVLLRVEEGPHEGGQEVIGNESSGLFAIKVVSAGNTLSPGVEFRANDLVSEEVRVYRATDGKRLLAVRLDEPSTSHESYAISPDGARLAVLSQSKIQLIPVPSP
jgi:hypothetical protein